MLRMSPPQLAPNSSTNPSRPNHGHGTAKLAMPSKPSTASLHYFFFREWSSCRISSQNSLWRPWRSSFSHSSFSHAPSIKTPSSPSIPPASTTPVGNARSPLAKSPKSPPAKKIVVLSSIYTSSLASPVPTKYASYPSAFPPLRSNSHSSTETLWRSLRTSSTTSHEKWRRQFNLTSENEEPDFPCNGHKTARTVAERSDVYPFERTVHGEVWP